MSKKYWEQRQKDFNESLEKDEKKLYERMKRYYEIEQKRLEKEIQAFYSEYGEDNIVEFRNVMLSLSDADRQLMFEKYDEFSKKYPQYKHLLPVRENIYKLNRLEGLQYSIQMQQLTIGAKEQEELSNHLNKHARNCVNEVIEFYGLGTKFNLNDEKISELFVNKKWCDEKSFSDRIWDNRAKLTSYLQQDIASGIAQGKNLKSICQEMSLRFNKVSSSDMMRLLYTEDTFIQAETKGTLFEEMGYETYQIAPANDNKVCSICEALRNKEFQLKDRQPGTNYPPLHPWCRCTVFVEVDDEGDDLTNEELEELEEIMNGKPLEKNKKNDTIRVKEELLRKKNKDYDKSRGTFISDKRFNDLTIEARLNGAYIIRGGQDAEKYLDKRNADALCIGDILYFRKNVCVSEVLEETYHFMQNKNKVNDDKHPRLRVLLNEIEAKRYLIENASKYRIPRAETELTKKQLREYEKELAEFLKTYEEAD